MSLKKSVMLVDDTHNVCKIIAVNNNPNFSSTYHIPQKQLKATNFYLAAHKEFIYYLNNSNGN